MAELPRKIKPNFIKEAIVEVRFDTDFPLDAIYGIVYNEMKNDFVEFKNLPILQLPEKIRLNESNLKYKPYYQLKKNNYILQVGPKVISYINLEPYLGWKKYFVEQKKILKKIMKLKIIN
jgi:uncharacterized protein (TIGR04255 family)